MATTEQLKNLVDITLSRTKHFLQERKHIDPVVVVFDAATAVPVGGMPIPGIVLSQDEYKESFFNTGAKACRDTDTGMMTVLESWQLDLDKAVARDPARLAAAEDKIRKDGNLAAARAGYGIVRECVAICAQTEDHYYLVSQPFDALDGRGDVIPPNDKPDQNPYTFWFDEPSVFHDADGNRCVDGRILSLYKGAQKMDVSAG